MDPRWTKPKRIAAFYLAKRCFLLWNFGETEIVESGSLCNVYPRSSSSHFQSCFATPVWDSSGQCGCSHDFTWTICRSSHRTGPRHDGQRRSLVALCSSQGVLESQRWTTRTCGSLDQSQTGWSRSRREPEIPPTSAVTAWLIGTTRSDLVLFIPVGRLDRDVADCACANSSGAIITGSDRSFTVEIHGRQRRRKL